MAEADLAILAALEEETMKKTEKNPAAVALGRLGGLAAKGKGPRERFAKMTPEERTALARRAAAKRWGTRLPADATSSPETASGKDQTEDVLDRTDEEGSGEAPGGEA